MADRVLDDRNLEFVVGQRGTNLLIVDGYTFSKNNKLDRTVYWSCRYRMNGDACRARVMTTLKENGFHRITITQPIHNHEPTMRMNKQILNVSKTN